MFKVKTAEETAARLAYEEAVANKYEKNKLRKLSHLHVLLHVILQDYPKLVKKSVKYLTNLVAQS
jgi:hypothetical protein